MISLLLTLGTLFNFMSPSINNDEWTIINTHLESEQTSWKNQIERIGSKEDVDMVGNKFTLFLREFLRSYDPLFIDGRAQALPTKKKVQSPGWKLLNKAKERKNELRKEAFRTGASEATRKEWRSAVKVISNLKKKKRKEEDHKSKRYQENAFHKNFFSFAKDTVLGVFGVKKSQPEFGRDEANIHLQSTYGRRTEKGKCDWFTELPRDKFNIPFNEVNITGAHVRQVLAKTKKTSAPGPDGIPFGVLFKLEAVHEMLAAMFNKCIQLGTCPSYWCESKVVLCHKKGSLKEFSNYRMIALGSCIGKTLNLIVAKRLTGYLVANNLIDSRIQKGFLHDISGCLEHIEVLNSVMREAKLKKITLHVTWLDLRDAFGSIPASLTIASLVRYKVPTSIIAYVQSILTRNTGMVVTSKWSSDIFRFENGLPQGNPISPILFLAAFNVLLEKITAEFTKYSFKLDEHQICQLAYCDDLVLLSKDKRGLQKMLNMTNACASEMGLAFRPDKCRVMSISSGCNKRVEFKIADKLIPSVLDTDVTFLGHRIFVEKTASSTYESVKATIAVKLENIDKSKIRQEYKVKIFKEYLLPSLRFLLITHDISATNLKHLDALETKYLKKWTGLAHSANTVVLRSKHFLDIKSFSDLNEEARAINTFNLRSTADRQVQYAIRKDRDAPATSLRTPPRHNRNWLDHCKKNIKANLEEKRESDQLQAVNKLVQQGDLLRLAIEENTDLTWKSQLLSMPKGTLKFLVNSVVDTLPTRSNLFRWGKTTSKACLLCGNIESTKHILNGCPVSLMSGRYTWRHDSIVHYIASRVNKTDFEVYADIDGFRTPGGGTVPPRLLITREKPDICIVNWEEDEVALFELTVPFEDRIEEANKIKDCKYEDLLNDLSANGCRVGYASFEVGSRGWISKDNIERLKDINSFTTASNNWRNFVAEIGKLALLASYYIYISRASTQWVQPELLKPPRD